MLESDKIYNTKETTGVLQGPALGHFLFFFYMNDLDKCIEDSQKTMFADDTTIIKYEESANPLIDSDIHQLSKWFIDNKLTVNVEKCEAKFFGSKQPHDVFLMNKALTYQKSCKYFELLLASGPDSENTLIMLLKYITSFVD